MSTVSEDVLEFWFDDALVSPVAAAARSPVWFAPGSAFDAEIRERFGALPEQALDGGLDEWRRGPRTRLALVLVLDQFPRNLYRGSARSFAYDALAREVAFDALDQGDDTVLHVLEALFLYLPLEHSESLADQDRCVRLCEKLCDRAPAGLEDLAAQFAGYARRHRDVIAAHGRFPHRNAVLGRESTDAEREYLDAGGETFGGEPAP